MLATLPNPVYTPAKRFWNLFLWIFVSVRSLKIPRKLRHREESQEKRNKDTYLLSFLLTFSVLLRRHTKKRKSGSEPSGQPSEEEEEEERG